MNRVWFQGGLLIGLLALGHASGPGGSSPPASSPAKEHQVKAVFLLNFTRFTEWPAGTFATTNSPIVIGILGDDPFGPVLDQTMASELSQGRPLSVWRGRRLEDVAGCHLLFISRSENARLGQLMRALQDRPVLTVGETAAYQQAGGMITFVVAENRVRFEINTNAVKRTQLEISAKLLQIARIAPPPEKR